MAKATGIEEMKIVERGDTRASWTYSRVFRLTFYTAAVLFGLVGGIALYRAGGDRFLQIWACLGGR
jgi:hypothetical protein